jgi:choline dehydrogenase-like flavoprotein
MLKPPLVTSPRASSRYPDGVGNASGHLGRNYMRHATTFCIGIMPGPVHMNRGSRFAGIVLDERGHRPQRGFAGGYIIEAAADHPFDMALYLGGWGEEVADFMEHYPYLAGAWVTGEDPPEARNRIYLHAEKKDKHGLPVPVVEYATHANSGAINAHAAQRTEAIYASLDARRITTRPHVGGGCHNMGVARMKAKPDDGVTDRWGRVHEVPNLFVSDGSVITSSSAANPTLTIVALALRQAGHIAEAMQRREL